jgi:hypothetical protein
MVGRWGLQLLGDSPGRRGGKKRTAPGNMEPGAFRSAEPTCRRAVLDYFSAALRAVFRFRRRASAAFIALASLGLT